MATAVYYNKIIRKIVVGFGNLFNDIYLVRYDASDNEVQRQKVPIFYGPKERYVMRLEGDPSLDKKTQVTLPLMSFEMTGLEYDASRKQITNSKNFAKSTTSNSSLLSQYNPVPYNFDFSLNLYVRNIEDGTQLIEHILPFFTPDYTLKLNMIPEMGIVKEIPIVLKDTKYEVDYEGSATGDVRKIIWTLNFTAKGFVYGPVTSGSIIKQSITTILDEDALKDGQLTFNMASSTGNYLNGELVYQGYTSDSATATAKVVSWDSSTRKLIVNQIDGHFSTQTILHGVTSRAKYTLTSYYITPTHLANTIVTVSPYSANIDSYNVVTTTSEFPNA